MHYFVNNLRKNGAWESSSMKCLISEGKNAYIMLGRSVDDMNCDGNSAPEKVNSKMQDNDVEDSNKSISTSKY